MSILDTVSLLKFRGVSFFLVRDSTEFNLKICETRGLDGWNLSLVEGVFCTS